MCEMDIPDILFTDCDYFGDRQDESPVCCIFCYRYDICLEYYKIQAAARGAARRYENAKGD